MVGFVSITFGQDTTKTAPVAIQKGLKNAPGVRFPSSYAKNVGGEKTKEDIQGKFIIEQYSLQINTTEAKNAIQVVGTTLEINEATIFGSDIDSISYKVSDSELMNTEDYLFRIFGEVPETIPEDLPPNVFVHKTDNVDCYGIAQLSDGRILIPYNGLLLYLRKY